MQPKNKTSDSRFKSELDFTKESTSEVKYNVLPIPRDHYNVVPNFAHVLSIPSIFSSNIWLLLLDIKSVATMKNRPKRIDFTY